MYLLLPRLPSTSTESATGCERLAQTGRQTQTVRRQVRDQRLETNKTANCSLAWSAGIQHHRGAGESAFSGHMKNLLGHQNQSSIEQGPAWAASASHTDTRLGISDSAGEISAANDMKVQMMALADSLKTGLKPSKKSKVSDFSVGFGKLTIPEVPAPPGNVVPKPKKMSRAARQEEKTLQDAERKEKDSQKKQDAKDKKVALFLIAR
jgi:hypothetical protein